jgi:acyl carrier protein
MNIEQELNAIVVKKVKGAFSESSKLSEAGLDSLDVMELAFDIEDHFKIQLPQLGSEMLSVTFGDLCKLVQQQLTAAPATPS